MADWNVDFVEMLLTKAAKAALDLGGRILFAVIAFLVGVQIIKLLRKLVKNAMKKAGADIGVMQFMDSLLKAALYVVLAFLVAASFGVDAASIVALLGSAGVAIGLAVQGSLSNLAGGVLILLLKPFKVGDYIIEGSTNKEGTVSEIQIFYTKLTTPDNRVIILPNGSLANNSIVNVTTAHCRRLDVQVGVPYGADLKAAKQALSQMLAEDPKAMRDKEQLVFVEQLGDSSVVLDVRCWFLNEDYWEGKWRITENCKHALDGAGIPIPFPQLDVHLEESSHAPGYSPNGS